MDSLLLRGKYGTAFRAPTMSDLFQGESGSTRPLSTTTTARCSASTPPKPGPNCPAACGNRQVFSTTAGNLDLDPINADVWSAGVVWAPMDRMSLSLDYHSWDIEDEVIRQSSDDLDAAPSTAAARGCEDINSALCQAIAASRSPAMPWTW